MTLGELLTVLGGSGQMSGPIGGVLSAAARDLAVTAVAYDSRAAAPGSVFVALQGEKADGASFAGQAVARGAIAVVSAREAPATCAAPWIRVPDDRLALAALSAAFYGHPSRALRVVGITGTNGKTTCAYLVREVFEAAGVPCGLMGTVQYRIGPTVREASRTTPEATDLQQMFREMIEAGCGACAMEVSSHALALKRAESTSFAAAVFTNLTRDHLDFHQDIDRFLAAKRRLFELLPPGAPSVVNVDDPRGALLAAQFKPTVTYGVDRPADVMPVAMPALLLGLSFDARTPAGTVQVRSRLGGRFNVYNLLAAVATGVAAGLPVPAIEAGLARVESVPGRFQVVSSADDDVAVIVDYAHTDDALKNLLEAVRPIATARLLTVFGCGGDRDRTKRPLMGAVAARLSDIVAITSDNPRSEDPEAIIDEVVRGIAQPGDRGRAPSSTAPGARPAPVCWRIADRRAAIDRAVSEAQPGDVVVVAGKGHEKYQVVRDKTLPFDDVAVAHEARQAPRPESLVTAAALALTAAGLAQAMAGTILSGPADAVFAGVSIDSRTLQPGCLFFAIIGERLDGHRYIGAAHAAGAAGIVVSDAASGGGPWPPGLTVIGVDDTTRALQRAAKHIRRASGAQVVAITGSAGKTTTKEMTADLLGARFRVLRNHGNFNNHIGLPLSLIELRQRPEIAVVELGMNHAGEIRALVELAEPDVRVWTLVAEVHSAFFPSIDAIADAKAEILEGATPSSLVVANAADPLVMSRVATSPARVMTFGIDVPADVGATDVRDDGLAGTRARVVTPDGQIEIAVPLLGRGHLANALAALAVGTHFGVALDVMAARVAAFTPATRRGEVWRLRDGLTLVDDSYNSNPRALQRTLEAIAAETGCRRRVAVLGEMLELGDQAPALHESCGRAAAQAGIALLVTVGGAPAAAMAAGAVAAGMPASAVLHVATSAEAAEAVMPRLCDGDLLLVKGSRGIRTDLVVERVKAERA